jgi:hypothetical protein
MMVTGIIFLAVTVVTANWNAEPMNFLTGLKDDHMINFLEI